MGPENIVLFSPPFNDYLGHPQSIENLPVEHFISQFSIEGLVISILPGATWLNEQGFYSDPPKPASDSLSSKLRPIV